MFKTGDKVKIVYSPIPECLGCIATVEVDCFARNWVNIILDDGRRYAWNKYWLHHADSVEGLLTEEELIRIQNYNNDEIIKCS